MGSNTSSLFFTKSCCSEKKNDSIISNEISIEKQHKPNIKYIMKIDQEDDSCLQEIMLTYEQLLNQKSLSTSILTNSKTRNRSISLDQRFSHKKEDSKNRSKTLEKIKQNQARSLSALTIIELYRRDQSKSKINGILKNRSKTHSSSHQQKRKLQVKFLN